MLLAPAQACVYSIEARADDEARLAEGWRGWWSRGDWGASSSTRGRPCRRPHVHPWRPASARTDQNIPGIQGADTARFDTLFERCERQVYGYLYRVLGDRQVAADLCQETFLRAWRHRERVAEYSEPLGWLLRVATNLALNHRRHGRTRVGVRHRLLARWTPRAAGR